MRESNGFSKSYFRGTCIQVREALQELVFSNNLEQTSMEMVVTAFRLYFSQREK